ncbi:hypothetical protein B5M09_013233 [Aphanomyces astaci]|uniref:Uncharacterized protein n=1 Tax=Aphanomyces astaci TaxID=112090 RepID=A0A3R7YXA3_APHAT|nr:hypothetical protein B5M09_013233 [Aphanomyces astaci]
MERVGDVIDENGLRQQLKDPTMVRTFVKVVAARVTPSYLLDRVEEQMKIMPANNLVAFADILREQLDRTHDADMVNQQMNSYGSKRKGVALRNMRRKPTKLFETSGNSEEITHKRTGDPPATKYGPQANAR